MERYLIIVESTSTGSPDLPGCMATGHNREEIERNMHEAVALHLAGLRGQRPRLTTYTKRASRFPEPLVRDVSRKMGQPWRKQYHKLTPLRFELAASKRRNDCEKLEYAQYPSNLKKETYSAYARASVTRNAEGWLGQFFGAEAPWQPTAYCSGWSRYPKSSDFFRSLHRLATCKPQTHHKVRIGG